MELNETAVRIAIKLIKPIEGLSLHAYPDPVSPLSKALSAHGMLGKWMNGNLKWDDLPENFQALSGHPWSVGYGETQGVTKDTVYTLEEAERRLDTRVRGFMEEVIKFSPKLAKQASERIAAVTSLAYNIGMGDDKRNPQIPGYRTSTVAKMIAAENWAGAAAAILLWNKGGKPPKIIDGLDKRRKIEAALFNSVTG